MKLLVTGGAGFIGSNFIRYTLEKYPDDEIINLDLLTYAGNLENLSLLPNSAKYQFVHGSICDSALIQPLVNKCDAIVHFAAESHVDRSIKGSDVFMTTNILGTQVLLEAARIAGGRRFHHVSTDEVYGSLSSLDSPFNESTPYNPHSPYSASKAASDHLVRAYIHTYGLPATISNCSNNYGPYQFPEKLHGLFITNLLDGNKVPLYGSGLQVRDWLFVEDHCRAIDLILRYGSIGESYCIGGGAERSNIEVAKKILALSGFSESMISYTPDRLGHDFRYAIDFSKITRELGWLPSVGFDEGMARTVEWYSLNRHWWEPLKTR